MRITRACLWIDEGAGMAKVWIARLRGNRPTKADTKRNLLGVDDHHLIIIRRRQGEFSAVPVCPWRCIAKCHSDFREMMQRWFARDPARYCRLARQTGAPDKPSRNANMKSEPLMRTMALLLSTALLIAACADGEHPTSPSRSRATSPAPADAAPAGLNAVVPNAKPTDQVGFTKVFTVKSAMVHLPFGNPATATATAYCPAGSYPVSGSYGVYLNVEGFRIMYNEPFANGWSVTAEVISPYAGTTFDVTVVCIQ
jgi:hypothetical protein